jgi:hypothetical protein
MHIIGWRSGLSTSKSTAEHGVPCPATCKRGDDSEACVTNLARVYRGLGREVNHGGFGKIYGAV